MIAEFTGKKMKAERRKKIKEKFNDEVKRNFQTTKLVPFP